MKKCIEIYVMLFKNWFLKKKKKNLKTEHMCLKWCTKQDNVSFSFMRVLSYLFSKF